MQVVAALTEYDPDKKGFIVSFKIEEGQQYRVGTVDFRSSIADFDPRARCAAFRASMSARSTMSSRSRSPPRRCRSRPRAAAMRSPWCARAATAISKRTRSRSCSTIDEGPRTYIERINLRGNTRTRDYVIRREFDLSEGDAYNRALVDRAERRLKNLDYFKSVKITTEPGSSSDRVILIVDMEEKSTGDFSISGGYSTTDGALAEVSVSERNLLGKGLYAKASVHLRPICARRIAVVRRALSARLPHRARIRHLLSPAIVEQLYGYGVTTLGFSPRLGFALREDLSLQLRYSLYQQSITLASAYNNCNNNAANTSLAFNPTPAYIQNVLGGVDPPTRRVQVTTATAATPTAKLQLAGPQGAGERPDLTSALGYTLTYNTLDNTKNPTDGLLVDFKQDFAGVGGDVTYLQDRAGHASTTRRWCPRSSV